MTRPGKVVHFNREGRAERYAAVWATFNKLGCVSETARQLNMHRRTVQRILHRPDLEDRVRAYEEKKEQS